jgi:D-serine deaminase-like pyridoxal phosphate-dependent protein
MDQHTFIALPEGADEGQAGDVRVGDVIAFGASHPCLTFDKWRQLHLVDERLRVTDTWATYF